MASREPGSTRLSVQDWLQAGYTILAEEGRQSLKVDRLCQRLSVTKGSFYWHFTDMAGYRGALIEAWAEQRGEEHRVYQQIQDREPAERLSMLVTALVSPRHWKLERAMREWARNDDSVAAGVDAADRRVLRTVRQAFLDLGFSPRRPNSGRRRPSPRASAFCRSPVARRIRSPPRSGSGSSSSCCGPDRDSGALTGAERG